MGNDATAKPAEKPKGRPVRPAAAAKVATPWGSATVVEEVKVSQRVGDRKFASILQLLQDGRGAPFVRIAYTTDGITRRGPVTLRPKDLEKLRSALEPGSALAAAFGWTPAERGPTATDGAGGGA